MNEDVPMIFTYYILAIYKCMFSTIYPGNHLVSSSV
jgi:hypothetical protein